MSQSASGQQPPKPRGLKLADLLPNKAAVSTSIGTLYVRHANVSDLKSFNVESAHDLGKAVIRRLCNRNESKQDSSPLDERDLHTLTDSDIAALANAVAKQSGWVELPAGAGCGELGNAAKQANAQEEARNKKMFDDMRKSLESSYHFLGKTELEKLQQQMAGLAELRSALPDADALRASVNAAGFLGGAWADGVTPKSALDIVQDSIDAGRVAAASPPPRTIEISPIHVPPSFEETPVGRATLESTKRIREVSQNMDALVNLVAGLNQTVIQDVLPAWVKQVEADQKGAKEAFEQAAKGLKWTKLAVWTSVVATLVATGWQVYVAQEIDRQNSEQQKRAEDLMRGQLEVQQKLLDQQARDAKAQIEQQSRDAAALREFVAEQNRAKRSFAADKGRQ